MFFLDRRYKFDCGACKVTYAGAAGSLDPPAVPRQLVGNYNLSVS